MQQMTQQEQLIMQIKIVKQQAEQLSEMNKRVWGTFRERLLRDTEASKRKDVIAFWNLY